VFLGFHLNANFESYFMPPIIKTVAYLRVSTIDQDLDKNRAEILHLSNEKNLGQVEFIEEKVSGKVSWRHRKISYVLESLVQNDNLIVSELSRLGRSMLECMEILSIVAQKGINIYAVKGNWQLDQSIQSKIIAMAFAMAAEIERDLISKRTIEALRARKAAGLPLGRPKGFGKSKLDPYEPEIEALLNNGATKKFIAIRYETTPANLHNWLKKHGMSKQKISEENNILR
jgi:DNA invertase Pin-like site-specific DNA recombinase